MDRSSVARWRRSPPSPLLTSLVLLVLLAGVCGVVVPQDRAPTPSGPSPAPLRSPTSKVSLTTRAAVTVSASASPNPTDVGVTTDFTQTATGCTIVCTYAWTWDDGTAAATSATAAHTFVRAGNYNVTAWANSTLSSGATSVLWIVVAPPVTVEAQGSQAVADAGQSIAFLARESGGTAPFSYQWVLGNGATPTSSDPTATFPSAGNQVDQVWANDSLHESSHAYWNVSVNADPGVTIHANTTLPAGQVGNFSASVTGGTAPFTYRWALGNGSFENQSTITHAFLSPGTRTVWVWANDSVGSSVTSSVQVVVSAGLAAIPTSSSDPALPGASVAFHGEVQGGTSPYTFSWVFGDGSFASVQNPSHSFSTGGSYLVKFWANDSAGHSAHGALEEYVGAALSAQASALPTVADAMAPVQLQATPAGGVGPFSESWRFGDGSSGTGPSVAHTYGFSGTYLPEVWVNDSQGESTLVSTSVVIDPALLLRAGAGSPSTDVRMPVPLLAEATGGTPPIQYAWHLSDGSVAQGSSSSQSFSSPGPVQVTAWANDSTGASSSSSFVVEVAPMLTADPSVNLTSTHVGVPVNLTGRFGGGTAPFTFFWTFGDTTVSTLQNNSKAYSNAGTYQLWFWVNDSVGSSSRGAITVTVLPVASSPPPITNESPTPAVLPWWTVAALVALIVAVALLLFLYLRRHLGAGLSSTVAVSELPTSPLAPRVEFLPKEEADYTGIGDDVPPWPSGAFTTIESVDPSILYRTAVHAKIAPENLFILTLQDPASLEETYQLRGATVLQVSRLEGERRIAPGEVDRIAHNAEIHFSEGTGRVVLVDATQSFLSATSLATTARFFHALQEAAERTDGRLLVFLNPREVTLQERRALEEGARRIRIGPKPLPSKGARGFPPG